MSLLNSREIGGYFGFELNDLNQFPYPDAKKYRSARAAFYDLIKKLDVQTIWMPKFICNTMIKPLELLGVVIYYYDLNHDFSPKIPNTLEDKSYILYVNYFGICTHIQQYLWEKYDHSRLIFDHSQAFYVKPFENIHTLYSPRKFFPVADGGLLVTSVKVKPSCSEEFVTNKFIQQYEHLFKRFLNGADQGYQQFQNSEQLLNDCLPKGISPISELILNNINYEILKQKRLENFKYLHSKLGDLNQIKIMAENLESPLTYPFLWNKKFSSQLIANKIFVPTYWADCLDRISDNSFEEKLVHQLTHFVCDHRYTIDDMQYQIDLIMEYLQ